MSVCGYWYKPRCLSFSEQCYGKTCCKPSSSSNPYGGCPIGTLQDGSGFGTFLQIKVLLEFKQLNILFKIVLTMFDGNLSIMTYEVHNENGVIVFIIEFEEEHFGQKRIIMIFLL